MLFTRAAPVLPGLSLEFFDRQLLENSKHLYLLRWYSWVDSNHRPSEPQSDALTN
jgi:hypothetical protein